MGQLTNLYVSESYQGLLKLTDSATGLTPSLQTVQDGLGGDSPLQISQTEVNISGSFSINNVPITNGTNGTSGTSGVAGSSGTSGTSGSSGTSGTSGINGSSGTSGSDGSSGTSGSDGSSGTSGDSLFALTGSIWNTTNDVGITGSLIVSGGLGIRSNEYTNYEDGSGTPLTISSNGTTGIDITTPMGGPIKLRSSGGIVVTGSLFVSSSVASDVVINGQLYVSSSSTNAANAPKITVSGSAGITTINRNSITTRNNTDSAGIFPSTILTNDLATADEIGFTVDPSAFGISGWTKGTVIYINDPTDSFPAMIGFQNKANYTNGTVTVLRDLDVTGSIDITGQYLVNGVPISGGTGSSGTSGTSGVDGSSGTSGVVDYTGLITTGSISTTQQITGSLILGNTVISGSLIGNTVNDGLIKIQSQLNSSSSLSIPFGYISSSNPDIQTNIIFGSNTASSGSGLLLANQTGSIVISGSNNIILGGSNRTNTLVTQGTYGYLGGGGNIGTVYPTLGTGSLLRPTINNNALQAPLNLQFTTSSLGQGNVSNNLIYGPTTINHQSGSSNFNVNYVGGNGFTSNANKTTLSLNPSIALNIFAGTDFPNVTLNHNSSSINYQGNIGGGLTVNNNYSSSVSTAVNNITVTGNLLGGQSNTLVVTGSNSGTRRVFNSNTILGRSNIINSDHSGSPFTGGHLVSTTVLGQELIVSASHTSTTVGGTVIVGRYNATGSNQESSQDAVFVVGTGTGAGNRRNALHIDNGSNVRITGSLNVSGSMTLGFNDGVDNITSIGFGASTLLYRNANKYTTAIGEFSGTQNKFADGTNNILLGGFNSQFSTGSQNFLVLPTGGNFKSGSINIIIGNTENITSGSQNILIGQMPSSLGPQVDAHFVVKSQSESNSYLFKSGSGANVPIQIGFPVEVTGSLDVSGDLTIASGSGTNDLFMYGHKMFNVGDFYSTEIQSGSAGVSGSVTYNNTGTSYGVTLASSSRLTVANAGVYSITFSAQLRESAGTDTIYMWLKKNGTNVADTGTKTVVRNNDENIMTVEYFVEAAANDYYEIVFQNNNGHAQLYYEAASGNIPATPSIITTVKQVR